MRSSPADRPATLVFWSKVDLTEHAKLQARASNESDVGEILQLTWSCFGNDMEDTTTVTMNQ